MSTTTKGFPSVQTIQTSAAPTTTPSSPIRESYIGSHSMHPSSVIMSTAKSMSSGSMTTGGITTTPSYSTEGLLGHKEVLTVNVDRINADLIRQVYTSISSWHPSSST